MGVTATPVPVVRPDTPVENLAGVTSRQAMLMRRLGIGSARDLLFYIPWRYEDTREIISIASLRAGDIQTIRARVAQVWKRRSPHKRMMLVEALLEDDSCSVAAIWFNQAFLAKQLHEGSEYLLSGKVEHGSKGVTLRNPTFERVADEQRHVGRLAPVYAETKGLSSRMLRAKIEPLLPMVSILNDPLPVSIIAQENLLGLADALRWVHFPPDLESLHRARERLAFDDLFFLQLAAQRARRRRLNSRGVVIPYRVEVAKEFVDSLPFTLTGAQRLAAHQILTDLASPGPMNRLLQGDVGSGKTVVAAMAALMTRTEGYQTAVMAPTEILARQHHATLTQMLEKHGLTPRLLLGSSSAGARREVLEALAGSQDYLLVGTHALIEDEVVLPRPGLIVVDEQHRFGVAQRQKLRQKVVDDVPNFLSMTATPIPRSLALTLYGDVNISELREMPTGRPYVETRLVHSSGRSPAYEFVRAQIKEGSQVFVVCPLIEESEKLTLRNATEEYARLHEQVFPEFRIELLHGRLSTAEKEDRMNRFARGDVDMLVATTVVEVGLDIPNATVMIIEEAERFGLAQLHQLRGRIGRGTRPSYCFLMTDSSDDATQRRLQAMVSSNDGFELAELDLRWRGAGDVVGLRQHGLPELRCADLLDYALLERARRQADKWLDEDPDLLLYAPLRDAMSAYQAVFDLD